MFISYDQLIGFYAPYLDNDIYHTMSIAKGETVPKTLMMRLLKLYLDIPESHPESKRIIGAIKLLIENGFDPNKETEGAELKESILDRLKILYRYYPKMGRERITRLKNFIKSYHKEVKEKNKGD